MSWELLAKAVAEAREQIAALAPDAQTAADGEAYVTRVMTAALGGAVLGHLFAENGLSRALPVHGGPNPDYIMRFAPVAAGQNYRLEGRLNGSERVGVGLYSYGANGAPLERGYAVFNDGDFSLEIGSDAFPIADDVRVMLTRTLHRDPDADPAWLRFTGGPPPGGLALATGSNDGALTFVAQSLGNNVREYLKWTRAVLAHPNQFAMAPPELAETVQGDPGTQYFLGCFDLSEGEWLEVTMPEDIGGYWSVHAYDFWFQHLQMPGVHDRNAVPDADGGIRFTIGPDAAADIDTRGRRRGALICRIIGTGGCPSAQVRS